MHNHNMHVIIFAEEMNIRITKKLVFPLASFIFLSPKDSLNEFFKFFVQKPLLLLFSWVSNIKMASETPKNAMNFADQKKKLLRYFSAITLQNQFFMLRFFITSSICFLKWFQHPQTSVFCCQLISCCIKNHSLLLKCLLFLYIMYFHSLYDTYI